MEDLLRSLGLWEHRNKFPRQVSGGQQQRCAIGRAHVKNPDLILCDEPTGALDYKTSKEVLELMERVNREYGCTLVIVTHNAAIAKMADRVLRLRDGRLASDEVNASPCPPPSSIGRRAMTPLARRLPRELRNNLGKYLGIFLLMTGSIALTSGFLLAAHSIGRIIDSMRDEYAIEDGRVTTSFEATSAQLKAAEDAAEDAGGAPTYTYSFTFNDRDLSVADRTDAEEDMVDALTDADARVDDLIDADSNQGIGYARNDVDGGSMMWTTLLDIIIVIVAFVFVVLTDATIEEESAIIGTLLASGYRKREIVLHYLALPAVVGILASLLGCALGVTVFTEPMRNLYYGSYSLPPFHVWWSWEIFVKCAVVPAAALILITLVGLLRKIGKTPLQFLRHEASGKAGTKRGLQLPEHMGFVSRFRLRVFLRNLGNFATLFAGVAFASLLLLFGLAILPTMTHHADNLETSLVAAHQYTLKAPLELEGTAEEREQRAALDRLQSVDGTLLTAAEDAEDELDDAADVAQEAVETAMASPSAASMQAASDALEKAQDKKDALYARLDDIADALDCDRDEVIDLIDDASGIDTDNDDIHPVNTTDNGTEKIAQAEKYAVYQLQYDRGEGNGTETVTVYGVSPDSRYWKDLGVGDGHVMFGGGLVDKFGWKDGQQVSLTDKFEGKDHAFGYDGNSWGSKSDMNAYMSIDDFNELFGNDPSYFNGYVSDEELDLDSRYFAGDTTPDDMRAVGDQFIGMMSDLIGMMVGLSVFIFLLFMYLLTKAVIIGSLTAIFRSMLLAYNGNIEIYVPWWSIAACVGIGFATYLVVALLHTRSIRRVSLSEALKVQE